MPGVSANFYEKSGKRKDKIPRYEKDRVQKWIELSCWKGKKKKAIYC
jgi:hypothetical protein